MAVVDTNYLMPNYSPNIDGTSFWAAQNMPWVIRIAASGLKFILGIPLILIGVSSNNFMFGSSWLGTASASALVMYVLLIPYLLALSFFLEGRDGIPPAYRFFQFFITKSGAKHVDRDTFMPASFDQDVRDERSDRYQAKMEAEELRAAAERAREKATRMNARAAERMEAEAERVRAAEEAARAAEEKFRATARERATRNRK